jgi:hypothetical protein
MKKATMLLVATVVILTSYTSYIANATPFTVIGDGSSGPVILSLVSWNSNHILTSNFRVHEFGWKVTNNSSSVFNNLMLVMPFTWGLFSQIEEYDWDNTNREWINTSYNGVDNTADGLYVKVRKDQGGASVSSMLMSDTDIPLSYNWPPTTATVNPFDSLPAWDIAPTLATSETVVFKTYIEQERRTASPALHGFYVQPYVVESSIPDPSTMLLLGSSLIGLVKVRRKKFFSRSLC